MKDEKKLFSSTAARSTNAAEATFPAAGSGSATHNATTFFSLKKAPSTAAVGAAALPHPPAAAAQLTAKTAAVAARLTPLPTAVAEGRVPAASLAKDVSLKGIKISRLSIESAYNASIGIDCKKKLNACTHMDKQAALQRARSRLLWDASVSCGTCSSRNSSNRGSAADSISASSTAMMAAALVKKTKGTLEAVKRRTAAAAAGARRKKRGNSAAAGKKRTRKRRRRRLTAAQRATRRAVMLREVRVTPQLVDVLLHTSMAADILQGQQPQQILAGGDRRNERLHKQQSPAKKADQKEKPEMRREGERQLGRRETTAKTLQQQAATGEMTVRMSRPAATRMIWQYVREQRLVVENDGCTVHADSRLQRLFGGRSRVHLFKELQSLLVPHLLFYEENEGDRAAAAEQTPDGEEMDDEEDEEGAQDESSSEYATDSGAEEEDASSVHFTRNANSRSHNYEKDKRQKLEPSNASGDRRNSAAAASKGLAAAVDVAGGAAASLSGTRRDALPRNSAKHTLTRTDVEKREQQADRSGWRGSKAEKREQSGRAARVKRLRLVQRLHRSGDSSSSSHSSSSGDDSSSTSSSEDSSNGSASSVSPRRRRRQKLIKESSDSSGSERSRHADTRHIRNSSSNRSSRSTTKVEEQSSECSDEAQGARSFFMMTSDTPSAAGASGRFGSGRGSSNSEVATSDSDDGSNSSERETQCRHGYFDRSNSTNPGSCRTSDQRCSTDHRSSSNANDRDDTTRGRSVGGGIVHTLHPGEGDAAAVRRRVTEGRAAAGDFSVAAERTMNTVVPNDRLSTLNSSSNSSSRSATSNGVSCGSRHDGHRAAGGDTGKCRPQNTAGQRDSGEEGMPVVEPSTAARDAAATAAPTAVTPAEAEARAGELWKSEKGPAEPPAGTAAAGAATAYSGDSLQFGQQNRSDAVEEDQTVWRRGDGGTGKVKRLPEECGRDAAGATKRETEAHNTLSSEGRPFGSVHPEIGQHYVTPSDAAAAAEERAQSDSGAAGSAKRPLLRLRDLFPTRNRYAEAVTRPHAKPSASQAASAPSAGCPCPPDGDSGATVSTSSSSPCCAVCCACSRTCSGGRAPVGVYRVDSTHLSLHKMNNSCLWCHACGGCCDAVAVPAYIPPYVDAAGSVLTVSRASALLQLTLLDIAPSSVVVAIEARPSRRVAAAVLRGKVRFYVSVLPWTDCRDNTCCCGSHESTGSSSSKIDRSSSVNTMSSGASRISENISVSESSRNESSSSSSEKTNSNSGRESMNSSNDGRMSSCEVGDNSSETLSTACNYYTKNISGGDAPVVRDASEIGISLLGACSSTGADCDSACPQSSNGTNYNGTEMSTGQVCNSRGSAEHGLSVTTEMGGGVPAAAVPTGRASETDGSGCLESGTFKLPAAAFGSKEEQQAASSTGTSAGASLREKEKFCEVENGVLVALGPSRGSGNDPETTGVAKEGGCRRAGAGCSSDMGPPSISNANSSSKHVSSHTTSSSSSSDSTSSNASSISFSSSCSSTSLESASYHSSPIEGRSGLCSFHQQSLHPVTVSVDRLLADDGDFRLRGRCKINRLNALFDYKILLYGMLVTSDGEHDAEALKDFPPESQASCSEARMTTPVPAAATPPIAAHAAADAAADAAAHTAVTSAAAAAPAGALAGTLPILTEQETAAQSDSPSVFLRTSTDETGASADDCASEAENEALASLGPTGETTAVTARTAAGTNIIGAAEAATVAARTEAGGALLATAASSTEGTVAVQHVRAAVTTEAGTRNATGATPPAPTAAAGEGRQNIAPAYNAECTQGLFRRASCARAEPCSDNVRGQQQQETNSRFLKEEEAEHQKRTLQRAGATEEDLLLQRRQQQLRDNRQPEQQTLLGKAGTPTQQQKQVGHQQQDQEQQPSAHNTARRGRETAAVDHRPVIVSLADAFLMQRAQPVMWDAKRAVIFLQSLQVPGLAAAAEACQLQGPELVELADDDLQSLCVHAPVLRRRVVAAIARLKERLLPSTQKQEQQHD